MPEEDDNAIRLHYTGEAYAIDPTRTYDQNSFKPRGLWWSVGTAWQDWCESEEFNKDGLRRIAPVHLNGANILLLATPGDVCEFSAKRCSSMGGPDWTALTKEFDGIEVNPYHWSLRHQKGLLWYYGWDCASGCIWNLDGVHLGKWS